MSQNRPLPAAIGDGQNAGGVVGLTTQLSSMETTSKKFATVDEYVSGTPEPGKTKLKELRSLIRKIVPEASEVISYSMPAFRMYGVLVWYAAYKNHIGFYPSSSGIEAFRTELSAYKWAKGSVQFPMNEPLPVKLITRMVTFRKKEDLQKQESKAAGKKGK